MRIGRNEVATGIFKKSIVIKDGESVEDIMKVILDMHKKSLWQTKEFAKNFDLSKYSGFRKLWKTIKNDITYKADDPGHEIVKSPRALYGIGIGDCKSFTIASGTTMVNAGIEVYYDLVHYGKKNMAHIYPVAVIDGREIIMDSVHDYFDERARGEELIYRYNPTTGKRSKKRNSIGQTEGGYIRMYVAKKTVAAYAGYRLAKQDHILSKIAGIGLMFWSGKDVIY